VDGQQVKGAEAWSAPPGKPMVTLTVHDGPGVDLTAEQIKKMTWHQHAKIWKARSMRTYVLVKWKVVAPRDSYSTVAAIPEVTAAHLSWSLMPSDT